MSIELLWEYVFSSLHIHVSATNPREDFMIGTQYYSCFNKSSKWMLQCKKVIEYQ